MQSLLRLVALLLFAVTAFAQPRFVDGDLPLTDTRYGTFTGDGVLTTNGRDFFLVWPGAENLRMARLVEGEKRVAKPILDVQGVASFDVVWTGTHFFVVAETTPAGEAAMLVGRLLDANGDPAGEPFVLKESVEAPRLASNGRSMVLLYNRQLSEIRWQVEAMLLRADGTPFYEPSNIGDPISNEAVVMTSPTSPSFDITSNGSGFGVVAGNATDIVLMTLTGEGMPRSLFHTTALNASFEAAIASDGDGYLAVWTDHTGVQSRVMRADGSTQPQFTLRQAGISRQYRHPSATWSRSGGYHASFLASTSSTYTDVVRIDPATLTSTSLGTGLYPHSNSSTTIAAVNGRVLAGWRDLENRPTTRDVSGSDGAPAAWGAAEQELGAAASSNSALLAVWSEVTDGARTLRSGVRNHVTGAWSENKIGGDEQVKLAASDGTEFLAITSTDAGWSALQLDANGKLRARSPLVAARAVHAVIWSGTQYVVAYVDAAQNVKVAAVSRTGTVSQGVVVRQGDTWDIDDMDLTSDGTDYLVVWQRNKFEICFPICDPQVEVLEGIRLDANLQRIGAAQIDIAGDDSYSASVAWDGRQYVVAWMTQTAYRVSTVSRTGVPSGTSRSVTPANSTYFVPDQSLVRVGNYVMLIWGTYDKPVFLLDGADVVATLPSPNTDRTAVALPLGRAAFIGTQLDHSAPHHGARRMHLRIADTVPTGPVPAAPVASVRHFNGQLRIDWTRPAGAVDGYRVEYRIGDGFWNEIGRWFDAEERTAPWATVKAGQTYAFRVRAMNDNGTSEYSAPAVMYMGKRRAVR
jgi:hypothetical protein